jgi:uncharacterized protein YggE
MRVLLLILALMPVVACASGHEHERQRAVSVSGTGEIEVIPDAAYVSMAIEARHKVLSTARKQVDDRVAAFLQLGDQLGIDRKHVKTAGMNVRPEYRWEEKTRKRYLDAYVVTRQLQVDLRDLDKLGALMTRAVEVGVNQVNPPQFRATNERELRRQALAQAAEDARANAQVLADTLDVKLGAVRKLDAQYNVHTPQPVYRMAAMRMEADTGGAEQTYETGQIKYTASVNASFDIN